MNKSPYFLLRCILALVGISHLILGVIGFTSGEIAVRAARIIYGTPFTLTPEASYIVKMLGVYVFTLGILAAFAWRDPIKNKAIINGLILFFSLGVLQRICFAGQIHAAFDISYGRIWINTIFFFIFALTLFLLRPKATIPAVES